MNEILEDTETEKEFKPNTEVEEEREEKWRRNMKVREGNTIYIY